jgi:hypothetical protein
MTVTISTSVIYSEESKEKIGTSAKGDVLAFEYYQEHQLRQPSHLSPEHTQRQLCSQQMLIVTAARRDDNNLKAAYFAQVTSFIFLCELAFRQARE